MVFAKISCVSSDLIYLRSVNQWSALELEHDDGLSGEKHDVWSPPALKRKLKFEDDIPFVDVHFGERIGQCAVFATPRIRLTSARRLSGKRDAMAAEFRVPILVPQLHESCHGTRPTPRRALSKAVASPD
jgi:hypothetical protein